MTEIKQKNKHAQYMGKLSHETRLKKWGEEEYKKKMTEWSKKGVEAKRNKKNENL